MAEQIKVDAKNVVSQANQAVQELASPPKAKTTSEVVKPTSQPVTMTSKPADVYVPTYSMSNYFQGLGLLFLILALLWFAVRLLKRYGRFGFMPRSSDLPKDALRLEAQLPIGPRKGLMVVRFLQKRLLLGVTEQQISVLTWERVDDGNVNFEEVMAKAKAREPKDSA